MLKKYLLLSCFLLVGHLLVGQELILHPSSDNNTVYENFNFPLYIPQAEYVFDGFLENNTQKEIRYNWSKVEVEKPEAWSIFICDDITCYSHFINRNPIDLSVDVANSGNMEIHFQPNGVAGCATVRLEVTDRDNPDKIYASTEYTVRLNLDDCAPNTILHAITPAELKIFPNPVTKSFSITANRIVDEVIVYNIVGRKVANFEYQNGKYYDIAHLPDGIYLVSLVSKLDGTVRTIRISKRAIRT